MDDALAVRFGEPVGDLRGDRERSRRLDRSALERRAQRLAFAVRQREEEAGVGRLADVVERADVRMIERRRGARLRFEATAGDGVRGEMRRRAP